MFEHGLLENKRILVTGGGSGLGEAMARRFLELGAELIICGRRRDVLETAANSMASDTGGKVTPFVCDIRDAGQVDAMMGKVWEQGALSVLVNNAAGNFIGQTNKLSFRAADAILSTTLHGTLYCTMAAGRRWIDGKTKGTVLSLLSTSTRTGKAFTVPSAMAKSGVLAMTRSLAVEWGPRGVRTVAIAPGPFPTPGAWERLYPTSRGGGQGIEKKNPLGRVGEQSELTNLAAYLISDQAAYINGEMIAIDGGQHLRTSGVEDMLGWSDGQWDEHRASRTNVR
jgi:NAD(P)-dependent dehydrogenase (short-subunit alcohol dehydrogenase family)